MILEPIPATLGMPLPPPGYLREVEALCRDLGAVLVLDEVQTGLGRTGSMWFHTQEDVEPDIVVTGKGLSGGVYPITATLMTAELHAFFDEHPFVHISTFGGAELGCVAALAVLDVDRGAGLPRPGRGGRSPPRGRAGRASRAEIRRRGLFMGLSFDDPAGGHRRRAAADPGRGVRRVRQQRPVGAAVPPAARHHRRRGRLAARHHPRRARRPAEPDGRSR